MALPPLETRLAANWPPAAWQDVTVLLAVSGGADSVALLRAMASLKTTGEGRLMVAHINHGLRGAESDGDQALVVELCRQLGIQCWTADIRLDANAGNQGQGLEAIARTARYEVLQEAASRIGARYVATAHTADDQAETILHRILRGTGLRGLSGIARTRTLGPATLIRPLLEIPRALLLAYLADRKQPYRNDSSNQNARFMRNRIRRELLPLLAEQYNARIEETLIQLGTLAREAQSVIDRLVDDLLTQCLRPSSTDAVRLDTAALNGEPRYVVREMFMAIWRRNAWPMQSMGFAQWDQLAEMILPGEQSPSGPARRQMFPGGILADASRNELSLTRSTMPE